MRLAHSVGLDASQTAFLPLEGERESFSLDIPSHRDLLTTPSLARSAGNEDKQQSDSVSWCEQLHRKTSVGG
jgi:hypothetical protein